MPDRILSGIKAIVAVNLRKKGKLQKEIAEYLNMDRSIVSHYLHGRHPSERVIRVSEEIIKLPVNYAIKIINSLSDDRDITSKIIKELYNAKIQVDPDRCILCGECLECPYGAIYKDSNYRINIDHDKCKLCGNCISTCQTDALILKALPNKLEE